MAADDAEAILLVKPLRTRIVFPDTEPHHIAAVVFGTFEACLHQRLADAFAEKFLLRIKPRKLDGTRRGDAGFDVVENQF